MPEAVTEPTARRRRLGVPAPLAALLAVAAVLGLAWALVLPAWQAPDENSHYGYVQSLVDGPGLPGVPDRPSLSTEQNVASTSVNSDQLAAALIARPEWDPGAFETFKQVEAEITDEQRSDGGGANAARSNPPLAYWYYALPYAAASSAGPFDRLEWMRLFGVLWLLVTVAAAWLLAGEVFGPSPSLQLTAAAVPALTPMATFISASVSPDGLMFALWTLALWLGARLLRRGLTLRRGVTFMVVVGLACWVKATSYALLPGALLAFGVAFWRTRDVRAAVPSLAALAAVVGGWVVTARILARPASEQLTSVATASGLDLRELTSYLWQFYFPRLWFMQDFFSTTSLPVYDTLLKGAWARFGWLEVVFPAPVYILLTVLTVGAVVLAAVAVWRKRATLDRGLLAFLVLVTISLMAGLHWQEYQLRLAGAGGFMQGRYVLPLIGIGALVAAAAVSLLPTRRRPTAVAVIVGGLFALQLFSLGLTLERFYA